MHYDKFPRCCVSSLVRSRSETSFLLLFVVPFREQRKQILLLKKMKTTSKIFSRWSSELINVENSSNS